MTENYELGPSLGQETTHRLSHLLGGGLMGLVLVVGLNLCRLDQLLTSVNMLRLSYPGLYFEWWPVELEGIGRAQVQTQARWRGSQGSG
jgi:hypothetical protein